MRLFVFALGLLAAAAGSRAQALNYPWCIVSAAYEGGQNCGFVSFDQCMTSRMGIGGFCVPNTQYRGPVTAAPAPRKPRNG